LKICSGHLTDNSELCLVLCKATTHKLFIRPSLFQKFHCMKRPSSRIWTCQSVFAVLSTTMVEVGGFWRSITKSKSLNQVLGVYIPSTVFSWRKASNGSYTHRQRCYLFEASELQCKMAFFFLHHDSWSRWSCEQYCVSSVGICCFHKIVVSSFLSFFFFFWSL